MKCLVLGGSGFLGTAISHALLANGYAVRIFARGRKPRNLALLFDGKIEYVHGDICSVRDWGELLDGCGVAFHCISNTLPQTGDRDPVFDLQTNVFPAVRLFQSAAAAATRLIFLSSAGTVYGAQKTPAIAESHATDPICAYGVGKLCIEKYLQFYGYASGVKYCIARLTNPFGEGQGQTGRQGVIGVFLRKALRGEHLEVWGDGKVVRDYLYISDVVAALLKMIDYTGRNPVFNIGSGVGRSLNDIIEAIGEVLRLPVTVKYLPARSCDVSHNVIDTSWARSALNWEPTVSFKAGLGRMAAWIERDLRPGRSAVMQVAAGTAGANTHGGGSGQCAGSKSPF
jgi:UDP-glucose 4-epimerase